MSLLNDILKKIKGIPSDISERLGEAGEAIKKEAKITLFRELVEIHLDHLTNIDPDLREVEKYKEMLAILKN